MVITRFRAIAAASSAIAGILAGILGSWLVGRWSWGIAVGVLILIAVTAGAEIVRAYAEKRNETRNGHLDEAATARTASMVIGGDANVADTTIATGNINQSRTTNIRRGIPFPAIAVCFIALLAAIGGTVVIGPRPHPPGPTPSPRPTRSTAAPSPTPTATSTLPLAAGPVLTAGGDYPYTLQGVVALTGPTDYLTGGQPAPAGSLYLFVIVQIKGKLTDRPLSAPDTSGDTEIDGPGCANSSLNACLVNQPGGFVSRADASMGMTLPQYGSPPELAPGTPYLTVLQTQISQSTDPDKLSLCPLHFSGESPGQQCIPLSLIYRKS